MAEDPGAAADSHAWLRHAQEGEPAQPHTPWCMGCGPDAPAGYHLEVYLHEGEVHATYTFGSAHAGGPGLAHGGAVAAVCDDLLGHVLTGSGIPAVTRMLQVDYQRPVLLGEPHRITGRVEAVDGRKVWLVCEGLGPDGVVRFSARGLFIKIGLEHFLAGLSAEERERAQEKIEELRAAGKDVTAW